MLPASPLPPEAPLTPLDKAVPGDAGLVPLDAVASLGWNVLREDVPLPVAVIRRERLAHNSAWMRRFSPSAVPTSPRTARRR